jgi:ribose transport system substrate-binding protein
MRGNRHPARSLVVLASVFVLVGAACGDGDGGGGEGDAPYTIGLSNGFIGSEWRTQMVEDVQQVFDEYEQEGLVDRLIVESADTDVSGQIQQIRNLISAGVDAIIVNPNSATALNAVFEEAANQGVLVIATDQAVTSESVTNVVIDQEEWGGGTRSGSPARWEPAARSWPSTGSPDTRPTRPGGTGPPRCSTRRGSRS